MLATAGTLGALALVAGLVVLARRPAKFGGELGFDERGRPILDLTCASCPDGTRAEIRGASATLAAGHARIALEPPVSLGERRLELAVREPGASEPDRVELMVRVSWVLGGDLRGLSQPIPKLAVQVDARPEVGVIVDGHSLDASATGARRYEIDVHDALTGPAAETVPLVRRVPYAITNAGGAVTRGELELRADIVPLRIEAPGESIVIDGSSFTLAGNTDRDASVTVEGRPITVDPSGRFAQLMSVSAVGDTTVTVRASAPGHAPRLYPIRVRRVKSLYTAAQEFARRATTSYSAIAEGLEAKVGWAVALDGTVRSVESDGYASRVVLDVKNGCPEAPCPVRLRCGSRVPFAAKDRISAYGYLAGKSSADVDGHSVPEVRVEFARGEP
jgi:hypothetical protein